MNRRKIFADFRQKDESNLWPICGKFNVTERAIRQLRRFEKESGQVLEGLELSLWLENRIGIIVNENV